MKTHFTDIVEKLKSTRSSWKMKLIVRMVFEYDDKKSETEIFIDNTNEQIIMLETDSDVDIITLFMKEYNGTDKQTERRRFGFKFVDSLTQ